MPLVKLLYDLITLKAVSFISDCLFTAALSFTAALCSLYKAFVYMCFRWCSC